MIDLLHKAVYAFVTGAAADHLIPLDSHPSNTRAFMNKPETQTP